MTTLIFWAIYVAGFLAVARGYFLVILHDSAKLSFSKYSMRSVDAEDVGFSIVGAALAAVLWPISGTGLLLYVWLRDHIAGGDISEWANDIVGHNNK